MSGEDAFASAGGAGDWAEVLFVEVVCTRALANALADGDLMQLGAAIDAEQTQRER